MFNLFINAWKVKEIRQKLIYIVIMLAVYRIGCAVNIPGLDNALLLSAQGANADNIFALITGGNYGSIFYMGIGPYITASIIMQLLTQVFPALEQLKDEGETGRQKINQITRYLAVGLALIQGSATVYSLRYLFIYQNPLSYITATAVLVTGTIFIMWLAELLTEKGIGNGSSFIIFANILSGLPASLTMVVGTAIGSDVLAWIKVILVGAIFVGIIAFAVRVQAGERRIPIHYSSNMRGQRFGKGSDQYIPLKVNIAGVMSIIFAISLLQVPTTIYQFTQNLTVKVVSDWLSIHHPFGATVYVVLIFCFTFFYTSFTINPVEMAQNLKNSQAVIPGIRQGKPTSDYIKAIINRMSWIGACFYAALALIPVLIQAIFKIPVGFGGTTLLIVTGVALEFVNQIETQLSVRHYSLSGSGKGGFLLN